MQTTITARTYAIDPAHSEVGFSVRHMMLSKVRGRFTKVSGTIQLGAGDVPEGITAEIDAASIETHEPQRDTHLRSDDFLAAETYPKLTFTSTAIAADGNDFTVTGDLTIHGTTKSVTLTGELEGRTTDPWGNDRVAYSAKTRINRKDFGLTWNQALETGGVLVGEDIDVVLDIQAVLTK
jgi:polyisoprenoid-binding protein YceI